MNRSEQANPDSGERATRVEHADAEFRLQRSCAKFNEWKYGFLDTPEQNADRVPMYAARWMALRAAQ
jgi:hypothetical protein